VVEPSGLEYHIDMSDFEKANLDRIIAAKGKKLFKEQVLSLLYVDDKIPNWINISVDESRRGKTVVRVLATRKWRPFAEAVRDYPDREIFHCVVPVPLGVDPEVGKYDVNLFHK
jgi:hypothetical protein